MSYIHIVKCLHSQSDLSNEVGSFQLLELLLIIQIVKEGATLHILQNQVEIILIAHTPIELYYIWTINKSMQLDFLNNLIQCI